VDLTDVDAVGIERAQDPTVALLEQRHE
jgi:hypothetical protein